MIIQCRNRTLVMLKTGQKSSVTCFCQKSKRQKDCIFSILIILLKIPCKKTQNY
jgi:hypothetical protein